jgi:hypothetical protein
MRGSLCIYSSVKQTFSGRLGGAQVGLESRKRYRHTQRRIFKLLMSGPLRDVEDDNIVR